MWHRSAQPKQTVINGRFEIQQGGVSAFLEYNLAGDVLQLIHTEVPRQLEGEGVGSELVKSALDWARENGKKVDIVCEFVAAYVNKHPEYNDLILR